MALEILEGWTHYDQNDILVKWDTLNDYSHILISAAYGRNGAGASILTGGASVGHNLRTSYAIGTAPSVMFEKYFSSNITNINIGFAIKLNDVELGDIMPLFSLIDTSLSAQAVFTRYFLQQISLILTPQQQLVFCSGNTRNRPLLIVGPYSPPIKRGVFSYIEVATSIGTPGAISLWIDGKAIFAGESVTTQSTVNAYAGGIRFFHHLGYAAAYQRNYYIDDIYVATSGGRFSDVTIETALPNDGGAIRQWTPSDGGTLNYDMVNELSPNDDIDYNTATAAGNIDTYKYPALANTAGTIHGVTINAVGMNKDNTAGSIMLKGVYREGGVNYETAWQQMGTIIYKDNIFGYLTNPATGNPFTISEVNAAELGIDRVT